MRSSKLVLVLLAVAAVAAVALAIPFLGAGGAAPQRAFEPPQEELAEITAPNDAMLARQLFGNDDDVDPSRLYAEARGDAAALKARNARWELTGPTNIGGRVLDIALDPNDAGTVYVASASGGVWKTTKADEPDEVRFQPAWPEDRTQAIGALAITPDGTLFAGTGETGPGGGSLTYGGDGVYRSKDGGKTWRQVGLAESSRISRIVVDSLGRIWVAASGPLFKEGGQRGIYRSDDGGDTWQRMLKGENPTTGGTDIAVDPENPKRVYAAMWDHLRQPDIRRYNGIGSGLFRSDDGGQTWKRLLSPQLGPSPHVGRIGIGLSESDPEVLYVNASTESGAYGGAYKSTDGGDTWTPIVHPRVAASHVVYGWWFARVWVDPKDPKHVFIAGIDLLESKDGGVNWEVSGGGLLGDPVHADQHAMAFDKRLAGGSRVYLGNDGGFYRSDKNGAQGSWEFAAYQPFSQLYGLDVSEQDPDRQVAGLQDNGVVRSYRNDEDFGPDQWNSYGGGDGERTLIKPGDQDLLYGCSQYGACFTKRADGPRRSFEHEVVSTRKNWFTPIELDPEDPKIAYTGGEIMSKSRDDAENWKAISLELSNGPGREANPLFKNFGTLTTISPAPERTGTIYAGTDDGNLWFTHDGAKTWTKADDGDLPKAWITRVQVDPDDPKIAYVTYSGFRSGVDDAYLLRTADGGRTWTDIGQRLPKAPLNDVNVIGEELVVASDVGVFASDDLGRSWERVGEGLPQSPVHELRFHEGSQQLFAATFGRSMWKVPFKG